MKQSGAAMNDIFFSSSEKPNQNLALIAKVAAGKTDKSKKLGVACAHFTANIITGLENIKLPDGSRSSEIFYGTPEENNWYYVEEDGTCIFGDLRFRKDDIVFAKRIVQPGPYIFSDMSLPAHLQKNEDACRLVQDDEFAFAVYEALCAGTWSMEGRNWQGSWVNAAKTVAQMRNLKEPYTKFLFGDVDEHEATIRDPDVQDIFNEIGWELEEQDPKELETVRRERTLRAIKLVENCEFAPIGDTPQWIAPHLLALRVSDDNDHIGRMIRAAFSGQMSYHDFMKFWFLFNSDYI